MQVKRHLFLGVVNIIKFNWPFYVSSVFLVIAGLGFWLWINWWICLLLTIGVLIVSMSSLIVSHWVYDRSGIYELPFLKEKQYGDDALLINLTAGFDESSPLLREKFPEATLRVFDFYKADAHPEPSVRRARQLYPLDPATEKIATDSVPVQDAEAEMILAFFAVHEIRNREERVRFFTELKRCLKREGKCFVVEHHRDFANFLAYTLGAFHFLPKSEFMHTFKEAGFRIAQVKKHTPFVNIYTLI